MKTAIKNLTPYILTSLIVVGCWRLRTMTDSYAWFPKGKERLELELALTPIFFYKVIFWLAISNLFIYIFKLGISKKYKIATVISVLTMFFYFFVSKLVDKECAPLYYQVFQNQSVSEPYHEDPIISAGENIGHLLTADIMNKEMNLRRYAISGLGKIKYKPATGNLIKIITDTTEIIELRADALIALSNIDKKIGKQINLKLGQSTNYKDKKTINLVNNWLNKE
jgi:hypothetical protein